MADTELQQLVINVGTTAQIEAAISGGTITENMLSISTDETPYAHTSSIETLDATDSITLANNTIYNGGAQTSLTIATPSGTVDNTFICEIDFTSGSTSTVINDDNNITWQGNDIVNGEFHPAINTRYTVMIYYNGVNFVALERGV